MRKYISVILVAAFLLLGISNVSALGESRVGKIRLQTSGFLNKCTHITIGAAYVHKVVLHAEQSNSWIALIDTAPVYTSEHVYALSSGCIHTLIHSQWDTPNLKVLITEATQYDTKSVDFDPPIYFRNGIFFFQGVTSISAGGETNWSNPGGSGIVYYESD